MTVPTIREELSAFLAEALRAAQTAGEVASVPAATFEVERRGDELGDYSSAAAMRLARLASAAPREIADAIVAHVPASASVKRVEVAGPGFINIWLDDAWVLRQIETIIAAGTAFGTSDVGAGETVQVEYLSANPTGPLTVGAGRVGVIGDALARVLKASGYAVTREFYVNDAGRQIELLGQSIYHHYAKRFDVAVPFPDDGYQGGYVAAWAATIAAEDGRRWLNGEAPDDLAAFELRAVEMGLASIRRDIDDLGISFDEWFSERAMRERGDVRATLELLSSKGLVTERDGATWFIAGEGTADRENVLIRSRGDPTYFATDIAYHRNKFETRGFGRVIDVWGADHQGHVPRMKAAMEAIGIEPERFEILVAQMVGIREGKSLTRQGKRSGKFIPLREVLDEVGVAATRYFFLSKAIDSQMEFDLELAKREDPENPVYYIQMAHARCAGIQRTAEAAPPAAEADPSRLGADEAALLRTMLAYPEVVADASANREPHRIAHYLLEFARAFHAYYNRNRVIGDDPALSAARLRLVLAVRQILANGLGLLGIEAPERM